MADISLTPGELNITYMNRGYPISFQTVHDGDITADTFVATVITPTASLPITLVKAYNGTTLKTTLSYTLSAANSALLPLSVVRWQLVQTSGGSSRILISGNWGAY